MLASLVHAVLSMCIALAVVINQLLASRGGRLSFHLIVFFFSNATYILHYVASHHEAKTRGIWKYTGFYPVLVVGLICLVACWDLLRRKVRKVPPSRHVFYVGVASGLVASFAFPGLALYAGDQQGTIAGDLLTEVLTQALRPATKMELQDNRLATSNATSRLQGLPHVVMTHVEAARLDIVNNRTTPFLSGLLNSGEGSLHTVFASISITLKSAWELLCGTMPSISGDVKEWQHAQFKAYCLPRVLRGLGYRTLCAKTDLGLSLVPKDVFGFEDVIAEEDPKQLLKLVDEWLAKRAKDNELVFIYFYYIGSHAPYSADRLQRRDQYPVSIQQFHKDPAWNTYANMIHRADRCIEHLRDMLALRGLCAQNTAWLVFGDHSEHIKEDPNLIRPFSISLESARTFVVTQLPTWVGQADTGKELRRFADLHATVLDVVGLIASGSSFPGISLRKEVRRNRGVYTFMHTDSSQCAKRQLGFSRLMHSDGVELYNTALDPHEEFPIRKGQDLSMESDCVKKWVEVNHQYRQSIPNINKHQSGLHHFAASLLHVWSVVKDPVILFSYASNGTKVQRFILEPGGEFALTGAGGRWAAHSLNGMVQEFNAEDSSVVIDMQQRIVRTPFQLSTSGSSSSCMEFQI
jgi:hypothetical protein